MDDFQLPQTTWDVVVLGTGVKPSLLAVALARAGKKVLQLDRNTYYGSNEAAFSLDEVEEWVTSTASAKSSPFSDASYEKRGNLERSRAYTITLAPHLVYWHSTLLKLLRDVDMTASFSWQAVGSWWVFATDEEVKVPASERGGVGGMAVEAGMKIMKGTVRKKGGWNKGRKAVPSAQAEAAKDEGAKDALPEMSRAEGASSTLRKVGGTVREVPCTFEDVAWSEDMSDRDRGYLGGFLRFVVKCSDEAESRYHKLFKDNASTPLTKFLSQNYPLPPFIISAIHSLTLLTTPPESTLLSDVVSRLAMHVSSLGSIPDIRSAAALTIAYGGSAELCQVWSRGAAVAGGLNVLERTITSYTETPEEEQALKVQLSTGESVTADWIVGDELPENNTESSNVRTEECLARAIYIVSTPLDDIVSKKYTDDRIFPSATVVTFPAGSIGDMDTKNEAPIYVVVHSAETQECPKGQALLYISTKATPQDGSRSQELLEIAAKKLLASCEGNDEILYVVRYVQHYNIPSSSEKKESRVLALKPLSLDLSFDEDAVEECKDVYAKIVGTKEGFLEMTEEQRKQQMEEE